MSHSLTRYLGSIPKVILRDAEAAFAAIEISSVADILRAARNASIAGTASLSAIQISALVQQTLDQLNEPIDEMIGKFAAEQTWSRLKRPTFEAGVFASTAQTGVR